MATIEKQLPDEIKDFINSGKAISEIDDIAEKAEIYNTSSLYSVIFQLIRKEIPASEFVNELSRELGWDKEMSVAVAHEIKEKVLGQIKYAVKDWGVDIEDIETPNPTPLDKLSLSSILGDLGIEVTEEAREDKESKETPQQERSQQSKDETISISKDLQGTEVAEIPISKSDTQQKGKDKEKTEEKKEEFKPKKKTESPSEDPFILHQEESSKEPQKRQNVEKRKRSFSFSKDGFFDSNKKEEEASSPKAQVEAPGDKSSSKKGGGFFGFGKKKKEKDKKVVHYSDNRTSLSNDDNGSFINLSNLEPSKEKKGPSPNNKKQGQSFDENFQKNKQKKPKQQTGKSEGLALGNVNSKNDSDKPKKKDFAQKDNKNKNDEEGPHLDGNTVDLSKK